MAPTRRGRRRTRSFARKRDPEHGRCELSVKQNGLSSLVAFGAFGRGESAPRLAGPFLRSPDHLIVAKELSKC